jgi:hypothetical protein
MKKILLAITFICAFSLLGTAQNTEKLLRSHKWFAAGELGSKTITLSKVAPAKFDWDAEFVNEVAMQYGKTAKADLIDPSGAEIKAGTYYTDSQYGYKVNGNVLHIRYEPSNWYYKIKTLPNGDLELEATTK